MNEEIATRTSPRKVQRKTVQRAARETPQAAGAAPKPGKGKENSDSSKPENVRNQGEGLREFLRGKRRSQFTG